MKRSHSASGFALVVTLLMMALIVIIIVAYLGNTRSDRSTSSLYANRLRAKMMADSGLAAANKLLYDNTKAGNYITAMPAPVPAPPPLRTELYRPDDTTFPDDYLRLDNAVGEILASRVSSNALPAPTPQIDPRPVATPMPAPPVGGSFGLAEPGANPSAADSFDFNQIVRLGTNPTGRLIDPDGRPAFGQWIRVRNSAGDLIGRYAFFIEDESMKVNVNAAGNNLGPPSEPNLRTNDLASAGPPLTSSQIQEVDPSATLPSTGVPPPDRAAAITALASAGPIGSRFSTKATLGVFSPTTVWQPSFSNIAHLLTTQSIDSNTTARGWKRLNVNAVVASSNSLSAATRISEWIRDAWTGPTGLSAFHEDAEGRNYQLFDDDRLRKQIAVSIVDYIDPDNVPTDMGDVAPEIGLPPIPVIGSERIPQLVTVDVIYRAQNRSVAAGSPPRTSAMVSMKMRFNFINLFDTPLSLQMPSGIGSSPLFDRIEVKGIPPLTKLSEIVFDKRSISYAIPITNLHAVVGTGFDIPPGVDGMSGSGVRSFETDWLVLEEPTTFRTGSGNPVFSPVDEMEITVYGPGDARLEKTAMTWSDAPTTGYRQSGTTTPGSTSAGDFLMDSATATPGTPAIPGVPRTIAAIFTQENVVASGSSTLTRQFGDPRFKPNILNERWRRQNRTDTETTFTTTALDARTDQVDMQPRTAGVDWYDQIGNRPLTYIRNGPLINVGELGNIAAAEYPWRTLYFQHPDRPTNSLNAVISDEVGAKRRGESLDWVLADLFRTSQEDAKSGGININSRFAAAGDYRVADSLFLGLPVGDAASALPGLDRDRAHKISTDPNSVLVAAISDRREARFADNDPVRPFFQIGELSAPLSRLFSLSTLVPGESRSTVTYSVLRNDPTTTSEGNQNYRSDMYVEQPFREVSNSITTRGDVFRVLFVGQSIRDISRNGDVDGADEIAAEYLGEAYLERRGLFGPSGVNPDIERTSDSSYHIISQRAVSE